MGPTNRLLWGQLGKEPDFNRNIVSKKLVSHCQSLRPNLGCRLSTTSPSSGTEHAIRLVEFDDGVQWATRLPTKRYIKGMEGRIVADWETRVKSEVATHKFLR